MPLKIRSKQYFDGLVADALGLSRKEVAYVTQAFLEEVFDSLVALEEVQLAGMFRLQVKARRGPGTERSLVVVRKRANRVKEAVRVRVDRQFYLSAKKSEPMGRKLKELHGPSARKEESHGKVRR